MTLPFSPSIAVIFLLMFARLAAMIAVMPGVGERAIPMRFRLIGALAITFAMFPLHQRLYTVDTANAGNLLALFVFEIVIGATLGLAVRIAATTMQLAGVVIAQSIGLGFAMQVDPTQGQQGAVVGNFLTLLATTLILVSDLHYMILAALNDSFTVLKPGTIPDSGDAVRFITLVSEQAFRVGIQIAAPFLVFSLIFNAGLGILSKMMPQMQVFFVAMPLQILGGMLLLLAVVGVMMTVYVSHIDALLREMATGAR